MLLSDEEIERHTGGDAAALAASVHGLSKSFKGARVLDDVSFDVAEGESLVLLGASGSGKTTILRIIAGLEEPDAGRVVLHDRDRKSTRLNSSHANISYAVFCLKKKKKEKRRC